MKGKSRCVLFRHNEWSQQQTAPCREFQPGSAIAQRTSREHISYRMPMQGCTRSRDQRRTRKPVDRLLRMQATLYRSDRERGGGMAAWETVVCVTVRSLLLEQPFEILLRGERWFPGRLQSAARGFVRLCHPR